MLDRISSFDERMLYVGMTILLKADSMEELEKRKEKIKIIGQTHNMDIVPHSYRQLDKGQAEKSEKASGISNNPYHA